MPHLTTVYPIKASGALLGLGGVGYGIAYGAKILLTQQATSTRELVGKPFGDTPPDGSGTYRERYRPFGEPVRLLILGDSIAAGLGAHTKKGTLGVQLAKNLADGLQRPVELRVEAISGSETVRVLEEQLPTLGEFYNPDYVLLVVGANDVIHRRELAESMDSLEKIVAELKARGSRILVGTCPDLAVVGVMPNPLKAIASYSSQRLGKSQVRLLRRMNVELIPLGETLSNEWKVDRRLFSEDRFHPSQRGYRLLAAEFATVLLKELPETAEAPTTRWRLPVRRQDPRAALA